MNDRPKRLWQRVLYHAMTGLGVDYRQWITLVRVSIKRDFRQSGQLMGDQGKSQRQPLMTLIMMLGIMSIFFTILIGAGSKNHFIPTLFFLTYVTVMMGMTILIDFASIVISPDDYHILAYRPLSSRTFLAVKIANIFFYIAILTTASGFLPWIAFSLFRGFNPIAFVGAAIATLSCTLSFSLLMILIYTSVLRYVHPRKLQRILSFLQLFMSFLIFGGNTFIPSLLTQKNVSGEGVSFLWLLYPPTWYAGWIDFSLGFFGWMPVAGVWLSLAAMCWLLWAATGKLSMTYSERLAVLTDTAEEEKTKPAEEPVRSKKKRRLFARDEGRVVSLLIRNHFYYDNRFRMGILGIIPMFVFYGIISFQGPGLQNPFASASPFSSFSGILLYMAYFMFPVMVKASMTYSDSWEASWILYSSPARISSLITSSRHCVVVLFVLPITLIVSSIYLWVISNVFQTILHTAVLLSFAYFLLQLSDCLKPEVPFSRQYNKGASSAVLMLLMLLGPLISFLVLPLFFYFVYSNLFLLVGTIVLLAAVIAWLEALLNKSLNRRFQANYSATSA